MERKQGSASFLGKCSVYHIELIEHGAFYGEA